MSAFYQTTLRRGNGKKDEELVFKYKPILDIESLSLIWQKREGDKLKRKTIIIYKKTKKKKKN